MIKVSDFIAQYLKEVYNISHVFLVSGGGAMHLNDSFGKHIVYSTAHNEQALAMMAEGYSRYNQELAVVNITTGPGGLNCLNGVFGQWTDSVPVLYISGQVKFTTTIASCPQIPLRQLGDQEVNIVSVVTPLTKYAVMITDPLSIKYHLDKAIYEAINGRKGPVWLDIPLDVQGAMIDPTQLIEFTPPQKPVYNLQIDQIIAKLTTAQRPLIIAGQGIRLSKQVETFLQLLKKTNIPVVTTFCGMDLLDYHHSNFVGRIGMVGQRSGNFALQNADVVLCLGTRNSIFSASYNYENFAKNAYKIIVDIDKPELDKPTVIPDLKIQADLGELLPTLLKAIPTIESPKWLNWCLDQKEKFSFKNTLEYQSNTHILNPYYFLHTLSKKTTDTIITSNASTCVITYQVGENHQGQRIFWNKGNASMGYGLPAAIGAYWSSKKSVICIEGDGSLMMNLQELQTVKHYNIPLKLFIINNKSYISITQTQNNFFEGRKVHSTKESGFSSPDFTEVAQAFGLPTVKITDPNHLDKQLNQILAIEGPVVCEVMVDSNYIFTPKLSARKLDDGTMVSPSLEDMFPFLDRDEYNKIMKISTDT
ncbi:MAG: thiamine pyrophosphate-binding protein [Brevinemataceae bacterium]